MGSTDKKCKIFLKVLNLVQQKQMEIEIEDEMK